MNSKNELLAYNINRKNQTQKGRSLGLSYTEDMYRCYFDRFWSGYTAEYIQQLEKDNSNQFRENKCKEKYVDVSSIIKHEQQDQQGNMSLGRIIQAVSQQKKVNQEPVQQKPVMQDFKKDKNASAMKKKGQSVVIEVGKVEDIKLEVKLPQKKQLPKQQAKNNEPYANTDIKNNSKPQITGKKVDLEPTGKANVSIKDANNLIAKNESLDKVVAKKVEVEQINQLAKQVNIPLLDQFKKGADTTQQIKQQEKKQEKKETIIPSNEPKSSSQVPKTLPKEDQQQEQEEVVDESESVYTMLAKNNQPQQKQQIIEHIENENHIEIVLSQTRNTQSVEINKADAEVNLQNQSSQMLSQNKQISQELNPYVEKAGFREEQKEKNDQDVQIGKDKIGINQNLNLQTENNIKRGLNQNNQSQQDRIQEENIKDEVHVQEYVDQSHFVTCITEDNQINQNQELLQSKMSGVEDYESQSYILAQEQQLSQNEKLDQQVEQVVKGFFDQLEMQGGILNEKVVKIKDTVCQLEQEKTKMYDKNNELVRENQELKANLSQANKKNAELAQNLQREKKQNFQYRFKIQQLEAKIKELQDKDIFNNSQEISLGQGIKRNRSQQVLFLKNDSPSHSNEVSKEQIVLNSELDKKEIVHYSDEDSEKNPSEQSDNQNEPNQKSQNDHESQSPPKSKNNLSSEVHNKIQKELSRKSSDS